MKPTKTLPKKLMVSLTSNLCLMCIQLDRVSQLTSLISFNPKTAGREWGGVGANLNPPCGFSKNASSYFNIIISHIIPENFVEILQVVQKI